MMRVNAKVMLSLCGLLAVSGTVCAQWQEGDFSGDLRWQGVVTQSRNPWVWAQGSLVAPLDLTISQAQAVDGRLQWRDLLTQTPLLLGKTEQLVPQGRPGLMPVIDYGHGVAGISVSWTKPGEARVVVPVRAQRDAPQGSGTLAFSLRVNAALVSTQAGVRRGHSVVAGVEDPGNGLPAAGMAQQGALVLPALRTLFGQHAPSWLGTDVAVGEELAMTALNDVRHHAVGGLYGAEIIAGSGVLSVVAGDVPDNWRVSLPIHITYR